MTQSTRREWREAGDLRPGARNVDPVRSGAVRTAGVMFLICFLAPTLNWALGLSTLVDADSVAATAANILSGEIVFRVGLTVELLMSAGLVILGVALYSILRTVDRDLALLALALKGMEAGLVAAVGLLSLAGMLFASTAMASTALTPEQLQLPVGVLLSSHTALFAVPMLILGLDMTLFFALFYRSRYIPRWLAGFGALSFVLIFVHALGYLLAPDLASTTLAQLVCYLPSCITEVVVGAWLLVRGIPKVPADSPQAEAA